MSLAVKKLLYHKTPVYLLAYTNSKNVSLKAII